MKDTDLYRHLLGLESPWTVARVSLAIKEQRVDVYAEHKKGIEFPCAECGRKLGIYDHAEERTADFEALRAMNLRTGRAWAIKELLRELWQCADREAAEHLFARWYGWATRSRLAPVIKVAKNSDISKIDDKERQSRGINAYE